MSIAATLAVLGHAPTSHSRCASIHGAPPELRLPAQSAGPFCLTDQNGKMVSDADLKGKWTLVYFGYIHCPDACPTALNDISIALEELGAP